MRKALRYCQAMTWLYLPITSQPRELDAKLVLAHFARLAGLRPVIGYKSSFMSEMPRLVPGVFLAHNARQKVEKLSTVRRYGNRVAVLDEEALVRQSDEIFWKKHDRTAFDSVDKILAWGEDDAAIWPVYGVARPEEVAIVGNPRFDLLRPELAALHAPEVSRLRARFGKYVLLNTNFPTVNNFTPQGGGVRMAKWAMDDAGQRLNDRFLAFKRAMFEAEFDLVAPLARAIAPLTLVVRPHPNEDHGPWHRAAAGCANVHVVFEGNVVPWLVGAEALVHNNCTTGIEGVFAGRKVLNFVPVASEFDNPLFHAFGTDCPDVASLVVAIAGDQVALDEVSANKLRSCVASLDGQMSGDRIARLIAAEPPELRPGAGTGKAGRVVAAGTMELKRFFKLMSYVLTSRGRKKRRFLATNYPDLRPSDLDLEQLGYSVEQIDLMMRQFPALDDAALDDRLTQIAAALGTAGPFRTERLHGGLVAVV